jgi:hypothetical protein
LADLLKSLPKPDLVIIEDVCFSTYTLQTQLWSSFRAAVWLTFGQSCVLECVPVTTLKRFASGSGAADKFAMEKALKIHHSELWKEEYAGKDDTIDAIWLWLWSQQNLSRIKLSSKPS